MNQVWTSEGHCGTLTFCVSLIHLTGSSGEIKVERRETMFAGLSFLEVGLVANGMNESRT